MGWLLALDGATDQLALALVAPSGEMLTRDLSGGAQASARLLPAVEELLREAGIAGASLQLIGFGRGPGAFTGLRAICAAVQGLAYGWSLPVLPVDSLLIVAEDAASRQLHPSSHWGVAMDARMGELYAARYRRSASGWETLEVPGLWQPESLRAHWQSSAELCPEDVAGSGLAMLGLHGVPGHDQVRSRSTALGRLCRHAVAAGATGVDAAQAMPLYVRDKVAQTTAERALRAVQA